MARCMLCSSTVGDHDVTCPHCGGAVDTDPEPGAPPSSGPLSESDDPTLVLGGGAAAGPTPWEPPSVFPASPPLAPPTEGATTAFPSSSSGLPSPFPESPPIASPADMWQAPESPPVPGSFGGHGGPSGRATQPPAYGAAAPAYGPPPAYGGGYGGPGAAGYGGATYAPPAYGGGYGYPYGPYGVQPKRTEGLAIGSFVTSLVGLALAFGCYLPILACPVGAILGHVALRRTDEKGTGGRGLALAGIIIGWIGTALLVAGVVLVIVIVATSASGSYE